MEEAQCKNRLFTNRQLVRLVIPLVVEQGLTILVGMCDGVMVSSVGEAAISGVSLVDMINAVALVLFAALATGGAVVTSQFLGARELEKARRSAGQLVLMAGGLGIGAAVLCEVFAVELLKLFFGSIAADVMEAGLLYLRITALSFPFIALYNAGAAIFRSQGNSKISMKVSLLMNAINVFGNALCIFVLKMGVEGVAIPTLVSRAVAAIVILALAARSKNGLRLEKAGLDHIDHRMMRNILRIGVPSACENSIFHLGRLVVVSMIALFGTTETSANAVANTMNQLGCVAGNAMGLAMVTVIGQCVGAQDREQIKYYVKKLMVWAYVLQGLSNAAIILFIGQLVGFYRSLSPETIALAKWLSVYHAAFTILMWPAAFVMPNALRAANDVKFTLYVGVGSMACFRVFSSWIMCVQMGMGAKGVWIAMTLDWACRISFFLTRMLSGKWLTKYKPA